MSEHDLLTVAEVASYLRLAERTVREMIDKGDLPAIKLNRAYRITRADLDSFLASRKEAKEES